MSPLSSIPSARLTADWPVSRIDTTPGLPPVAAPATAPNQPATPAGDPFGQWLQRFVAEVNQHQQAAAQTVQALQQGEPVPLHQAVIAMEEASVSFQLMVEVRNKLLEAYQELMRLQI
ncbi:MAG: flagellar hook-basal body complex protein FliE [Verrucomicrobiota bacterium]|nr:flagellar hook-basal body complex protein FliE [Limisphaera sp.]MDW8381046.1 flagellar hook-basal body complex protein FliE [Verrucomicrobiota bacterium]